MSSQCIYCFATTTSSEPSEHVLPEGVFGQNDFVLRHGEVCSDCNHGVLSRLDKMLAEAFQPVLPIFVKRRKRGRRPKFMRGDIDRMVRFERVGDHELSLSISTTVRPKPSSGGPLISWDVGGVRVERDPSDVSVHRFHASIPVDCGVARSIHKIALGALCKMKGRTAALSDELDDARKFISQSRGSFPVFRVEGTLLRENQGKYPHGHIMDLEFVDKPELGSVWVVAVCGINLAVSLRGRMRDIAHALTNHPKFDEVVGFHPDGRIREIDG